MTNTAKIDPNAFTNRQIIEKGLHLYNIPVPAMGEMKVTDRSETKGDIMVMAAMTNEGVDGFMAYNSHTGLKVFIPATAIQEMLIKEDE